MSDLTYGVRTHYHAINDIQGWGVSVEKPAALATEMEQVLSCSKYRHQLGRVSLLDAGESFSVMAASDILWAKSGTTTLEAALFGKPMLIYYRANWLTYLLFLAFKRVKDVGWPNLLAGRKVVPELIQLECRAESLVRYTNDWLDVPAARQAISERLLQVRGQLGHGDFAYNVAAEIITTLGCQNENRL